MNLSVGEIWVTFLGVYIWDEGEILNNESRKSYPTSSAAWDILRGKLCDRLKGIGQMKTNNITQFKPLLTRKKLSWERISPKLGVLTLTRCLICYFIANLRIKIFFFFFYIWENGDQYIKSDTKILTLETFHTAIHKKFKSQIQKKYSPFKNLFFFFLRFQ